MAFTYEQILRSQYENLAAETAQQLAELEAGRISEDAFRTTAAADRILEIDKSREALDRRAQSFVAGQQQQPQGNAFGLSKDEQEIAHNSYSGASKEEQERSYAHNKAKLRYLKSTGEYDGSQGKVFK